MRRDENELRPSAVVLKYPYGYSNFTMTHTITDKKKLLNRVRRIHGQMHAVEKALSEEKDPCSILQNLVAAHGAMKSLMAEIIEGHIRFHVLDPNKKATTDQAQATKELINIVKTYLK